MKLDTIPVYAITAMHLVVALPVHAQRYLDTLPASAYARAERFMQHRAADKMYRHRVDVRWLADGSRFWYSVDTPDGTERYVVDPVRNTKQLLVDRGTLAQGISAALDSVVEPRRLTLSEFQLSKDEKQVRFNVAKKGLTCDIATYRCSLGAAKPRADRGLRRSPDEKWDAFVRDNDIYVRQVACTSGASCETRLTTDGSADWAYGRAGTFQSISFSRTGEPRIPMVVWSPDSKKMVVMRWDVRGVEKFYKYDSTGKLVGKVTAGAWNVTDAEIDSTRSTLFVRGNGREPNTFKGHTKLYRMRPDGSGLVLLTPETGDHTTTVSPNGRFFVDTYSSTDVPPLTVVRSTDNGRVIRELERTDISPSTSLGWKPVEVQTLTASDGAPLYAAVYRPTNFDSTKRYPVVDHIYPMPLGAIRNWSFIGPTSEQQALAELGFIVLQIQPRGVRDPSPAIRNYYRTQYQGRYAEATLADHVEAIKQLGARFPWIDLDKVGLYGTSGGGLSTAAGMLRYPEFFKVGVAFAGNHDDRSEQTVVGESWRGTLRKDSTGKDNYEGDANYLLVNNLRGKLMLVHGDLDEAVHPSMTIRVAAALIDAGKRFDMMVFPDQGHSSGGWYGSRLMFDYFVRNLMGYEVPEYTFTGIADPIANMRRRKLPTTFVP